MQYYYIALMLLLCLTTSVRTVFAASYTTNFPGTESPISEGGNWVNGKTTGLDWQNVKITPGFATFAAPNPSSYDDATAILTGIWGADQYVRAVVNMPTVDKVYAQEIEIRLRSSISAHSNTGYEILGGSQIVRWNGPLGDFTVLQTVGTGGNLQHGDIFEATMIGNVITVYINGVQVQTAVDNTYTTGNPGMGFFTRNPSAAAFGFSSYTASNSPIGGDATPPNAPSDLRVR
jgi:hypothetical protein